VPELAGGTVVSGVCRNDGTSASPERRLGETEEAIERRLIADYLAREELGPVVAVYAARNAVVFVAYLLSARARDEGVAQGNSRIADERR
jgi:hypothetical protein